ncbi:MAG TPA: 4Fe-4S binding protein [Methanocorpusculum sp.]|nr:4Fe-4S binding protein [Methanocorpusculum sp.]
MIQIRREVCGYCGACVSVCPNGALTLIDTYLKIDEAKCAPACRLCARLCPLGAIAFEAPAASAAKPLFVVE